LTFPKIFLLSLFCLFSTLSYGEEKDPVSVELITEVETCEGGKPFLAGVLLHHAPGWHTYGETSGEMGMPTEIHWELPEGFTASAIKWPTPVEFDIEGMKGVGYEGDTLLLVAITPPSNSQEKITLKAKVDWLSCSSECCLPGSQSLESRPHKEMFKEIALADVNPSLLESKSPEEDHSLLLFLGMAFLGGMILNLMPCVLPVVSLKILNFVQMAGKNRRLILSHGLAYSLGVLLSFWVLAIALSILQAYGNSVGWGFQLQEPLFVALLAMILFVFSLSMFGIFEVGTMLQTLAGQQEVQKGNKGLSSSLFSGILATAVATPCTGPFLGPAVGFAVTQSPFISLLMFTSLGLGMAFPYLLLSAFPQLLRFLPKPGAWMITFRELVAFIMLATTLWLLWVFGAETSMMALFLLLQSFLILGIACWTWGKFGVLHRSKRTRRIALGCTVFLMLFGGKLAVDASKQVEETTDIAFNMESNPLKNEWVPFSKELLDKLTAEGKPVFIDFTARWCLICQTNHMALSTDQVEKKFDQLGVVKMKADWTRRDPSITEELKKFGRSGVPLYLYYDGKKTKPEILPQILTPETVMDYVAE